MLRLLRTLWRWWRSPLCTRLIVGLSMMLSPIIASGFATWLLTGHDAGRSIAAMILMFCCGYLMALGYAVLTGSLKVTKQEDSL